MPQFRTEIKIPQSLHKIEQKHAIFTIGSCFAEVIGEELSHRKFTTQVNPLGTMFSPDAIFKGLNLMIGKENLHEKHWVEDNGIFQHLDFHSSFGQSNHVALEEHIHDTLALQLEQLKKANHLIITLGTAYTYQYLETKKYIANCHKMPASWFRKDLVHVKHICQGFEYTYKNLKAINPNLNIILTVSPVRHTKEGLAENNLSKSILRAACHYLSTDFENVGYFPAFEIMMDDLRDYRFYGADMIHPNKTAENYIFEKFQESHFADNTILWQKKWSQIRQDLNHKPFHEKNEEHQKFLKQLLQKLEEISKDIDLSKEILELKERIFVVEN